MYGSGWKIARANQSAEENEESELPLESSLSSSQFEREYTWYSSTSRSPSRSTISTSLLPLGCQRRSWCLPARSRYCRIPLTSPFPFPSMDKKTEGAVFAINVP